MRILSSVLAACLASTAAAQLHCTTTPLGPGCGPVLTVTFVPNGNNHMLTMVGSNMVPGQHGVIVFGSQDLRFPLPGGCFVYTDFAYGHPFVVDHDGTNTLQRSWPHWLVGGVRLQMATVEVVGNDLVIKTTNGVLAECR